MSKFIKGSNWSNYSYKDVQNTLLLLRNNNTKEKNVSDISGRAHVIDLDKKIR